MRKEGVILATGLLIWGCSGPPGDPSVLAKVGEMRIEVADLRAFQEQLPPSYRRSKVEKEARRADLQTLIDRRLMDLDGRARGLDGDSQVLGKLKKREAKKLIDEMVNRQIRARVAISEEDILREYQEKGWDEQVETLEFFVSTRAKADEVAALLDNRADFIEVARSYSVDRVLKVPTGSPQSFKYSPNDQPRAVVEAVFSLSPGSTTEPVPLMDGFVFARVVERRKVELDQVRHKVEPEVVLKMKKSLRSGYLIELRKQFKLEFNQEGMDRVVQVLQDKVSLSEAQRGMAVYAYEGGILKVEEVLEAVKKKKREWPQIEERYVIAYLKENALPDRLMALDARNQGVDQEEAFQRWRENEKKDLMVARLRSLVLEEKLKITREDLESYYQEHKSRFTNPDRARVLELLTEDQAQARILRQQIEEGAEMAAVIQEYSIRKSPQDGNLRVSSLQSPFYGEEWIDAVMKAPLNQVQGPVQTRGGYSVFKVLERYPEEFFPLEGKVLKLVSNGVKEEKEREIFNQYLKDLRQEYGQRVEVYEEHLERL